MLPLFYYYYSFILIFYIFLIFKFFLTVTNFFSLYFFLMYFYCCALGTLWHLQKFLQNISCRKIAFGCGGLLGFQPRTLHLLGKHSTLSQPPDLFVLVYFLAKVSCFSPGQSQTVILQLHLLSNWELVFNIGLPIFAQAGSNLNPLVSTSLLTEIIGVNHCPSPIQLFLKIKFNLSLFAHIWLLYTHLNYAYYIFYIDFDFIF
jgi:hypothetical protein